MHCLLMKKHTNFANGSLIPASVPAVGAASNVMAIRVQPRQGTDAQAAFTAAKKAFQNLVVQYGVDSVAVSYDETLPSPQPGSGKTKPIMHEERQ